MIQRIQSVYLFLASILTITVYFNALYMHAMADPQRWVGIAFAVVLALACIASMGCIFLYKNRRNQLKWTKGALVLQTLAFGYGVGIVISLGGFGLFLWDEIMGAVILLAGCLSIIMARRSIQADQELVDSMDRIR